MRLIVFGASDAMRTHGVRRVVCETALGVGDSAGRLGVYYTLFVITFILPFYWATGRKWEITSGA